jgi:4a-hydroxytetrahydrobiopterin dehydratase
MNLSEKSCIPCTVGAPALTADQIGPLLAEVPDWRVIDNHHIERGFDFPDFRTALDFVNRVGEIAEQQGHHPDCHLGWGRVQVTIWTHKINALTESDFILAAKIDRIQPAAA